MDSPAVYRYLPTFLFERRYDVPTVIRRLYDECRRESIILGVFRADAFCGLAELYGYREPIRKIGVDCRPLERCWGRGIAGEALGMLADYLYGETDAGIITAGIMVENRASARVPEKNGFALAVRAADENWGYETPIKADKRIR